MIKWLIALAAFLLFLGASCPPKPPTPLPTPTPTPTASPTPAPTPTPGGDAIQFGTAGGRWFPKSPAGFVGCCNTPPRDGALSWTFAEPNEIDSYITAGGTLAVFRTGPYSDQGNGWGMIQSKPGTVSRLRQACQYANSKGIACIVEAGTDNWSMKNQNREFQLYNDSCDVTHAAPLPRYQRWSREVVHQVGDLKVIWSLGNEGWLCSPSKAWYDGLVATIRQSEKDFGYPTHPIGNVWQAGQVGINANGSRGPLYDFAEVHGSPEEFCNQGDVGIPVIWTESSNEDPPESNERMLHAKSCADNSGGTKAALIWRGGIVDAQWAGLFQTLGGHSPVLGPRKDSSCLWNKYQQSYNGVVNRTIDEATLARMQKAVEQVIAGGYSWLITPSGNNLISTGTSADDYQRIDYFSLLVAYAAPGCSIAGNPDAPNSFNEVDNLELQIAVDPCAQSGQYISWHPIIFGQPGNYNQIMHGDQLRQSPAVFKARDAWTVTSPCTTGPTPPPLETCGQMGGNVCMQHGSCPAGTTSLGNSSDCTPCCKRNPPPDCPITDADVDSWRVEIKSNATNQQMDLTPYACGPKVVAALNNCGTACCSLSAEKGNAACSDALYGQPAWSVLSGNPRLVQVYVDNSFTQKVASGSGKVKACGPKDSRSCVQATVKSTPPVCAMTHGSMGCATPYP